MTGVLRLVREGGFSADEWRRVVEAAPGVRLRLERTAVNPFTGETVRCRARPNAAEVRVNGRWCGLFHYGAGCVTLPTIDLRPTGHAAEAAVAVANLAERLGAQIVR